MSYLSNSVSDLPTKWNAFHTIQDFQKKKGIDLLFIDQMEEMAETGYCTCEDGKTFSVPKKVRAAAKEYTSNSADLFGAA